MIVHPLALLAAPEEGTDTNAAGLDSNFPNDELLVRKVVGITGPSLDVGIIFELKRVRSVSPAFMASFNAHALADRREGFTNTGALVVS